MVQELTLDPVTGVLELNSLPRNEVFQAEQAPNFVPVNIASSPPGTTIALDNVVTLVTNPSNCLPMTVCISGRVWAALLAYNVNPGALTMTHDITLTVDFGTGPQFMHISSAENRPLPVTQNANHQGQIDYCFTLAAGATQAVTFDVNYNCTNAAVCPDADYFGFSYEIIGWTE